MRGTLDEQTKVTILTKEQLVCIIQVIVSVCLVMLPLFASDDDPKLSIKYVKTQFQWNQKKDLVVEKLFDNFKPGSKNTQFH